MLIHLVIGNQLLFQLLPANSLVRVGMQHLLDNLNDLRVGCRSVRVVYLEFVREKVLELLVEDAAIFACSEGEDSIQHFIEDYSQGPDIC